MALSRGARLDQYEILSNIGAGGMGEVYRARDHKLGRDVALKVLTAGTADPDRLSRFEREARSASALNHPNIITIYDIGESGPVRYIAMELVEGKTLRALLADGAVPVSKWLPLVCQIADGLAKAHGAGIVHRDLKPENLMVTVDGFIKILDFGLAKLTLPESELTSEAPTAELATRPGMILGTVGYMSPEQARGRATDFRSDQFALGVILYELAAGQRPFKGDSVLDTLSAIVRDEPRPLAVAAPELPGPLRQVTERCLAKAPENRYASTREIASALSAVREGFLTSAVRPPAAPSRKRLWPALAAALAVVAGAVLFLKLSQHAAIDSIAVLPFVNASGDPETEYLSDGITESIINSLSHVEELRVVPRSTVFRYKGRGSDPGGTGRELKVRALLTGKVVKRGDRLSVQTELVDVSRDSQLWGEQYQRRVSDIFALQEDIAREIVGKLRLQLGSEEAGRLAKRYTESSEAYEAYLRGRFFWNKWTAQDWTKAVAHFEKAIEIDPRFALAHSGLADAYSVMGFYGAMPPGVAFGRAKLAATRAVEADDELAEAHASVALLKVMYEWDWSGSEREVKRAIELNPRYAMGHVVYALYLASVGETGASIGEAKKAQELEPMELLPNYSVAFTHFLARQYDEAIAQYQKTIDLHPQSLPAYVEISHVYAQKGKFDEAIAALQKVGYKGWALARAYALQGKKDEARRMVLELEAAAATQGYVPPPAIAYVWAALGDKDSAFAWVEKAYTERSPWLLAAKVHPMWDPLRDDPRFGALLRRMGLPD